MKHDMGFIGIGNMGNGMAKNLIKAGFAITIYDLNKKAVEGLVEQGAYAAGSSKEVGENSDVVMTMLPTSPPSHALEEQILGENGIAEGMKGGGIVIDGGNTSPKTTKEIALRLEERGLKMLDAAVSGGVKGAKEGSLAIMVGGDKSIFERCMPIFRAIGKKTAYVGPTGMGQTVKLVNNLIVYGTIALVSESVALGVKAGADPQAMIDVISAGAAGNWVLNNYFPEILDRNFHEGPGLGGAINQLGNAMVLGDELNIPLYLTNVIHETYKLAEIMGIGEDKEEYSIVQLWEKFIGKEVGKKSSFS